MPRIKDFRFKMSDAWGMIDGGYDSVLEFSDNGDITILFLVNLKPCKIVLTNKENQFIKDMCFLEKWNNKSYDNYYVLDGYMWSLSYAYDDIYVKANGSNGFPADFLVFLNLIHNKYYVPKADYEDENFIVSSIKNTEVLQLNS